MQLSIVACLLLLALSLGVDARAFRWKREHVLNRHQDDPAHEEEMKTNFENNWQLPKYAQFDWHQPRVQAARRPLEQRRDERWSYGWDEDKWEEEDPYFYRLPAVTPRKQYAQENRYDLYYTHQPYEYQADVQEEPVQPARAHPRYQVDDGPHYFDSNMERWFSDDSEYLAKLQKPKRDVMPKEQRAAAEELVDEVPTVQAQAEDLSALNETVTTDAHEVVTADAEAKVDIVKRSSEDIVANETATVKAEEEHQSTESPAQDVTEEPSAVVQAKKEEEPLETVEEKSLAKRGIRDHSGVAAFPHHDHLVRPGNMPFLESRRQFMDDSVNDDKAKIMKSYFQPGRGPVSAARRILKQQNKLSPELDQAQLNEQRQFQGNAAPRAMPIAQHEYKSNEAPKQQHRSLPSVDYWKQNDIIAVTEAAVDRMDIEQFANPANIDFQQAGWQRDFNVQLTKAPRYQATPKADYLVNYRRAPAGQHYRTTVAYANQGPELPGIMAVYAYQPPMLQGRNIVSPVKKAYLGASEAMHAAASSKGGDQHPDDQYQAAGGAHLGHDTTHKPVTQGHGAEDTPFAPFWKLDEKRWLAYADQMIQAKMEPTPK